jgi:uncharacterized iron-regulated membrane protein
MNSQVENKNTQVFTTAVKKTAVVSKKKPQVKKWVGFIHLWLGLISGVIIVFLGITGCILAFEQEIRTVTEPSLLTKAENRPYLPPSILKANAEKHLGGKQANGIEYPGRGKSAIVSYYGDESYKLITLNPYSGEVLKVKNMNRDFFRVVLDGHFYLWLPPHIGQPIVASATLIFLVMLISGIILWWPRNKAATKQRFSVKWKSSVKRRNYDLHNVLGFYMSWIGIIIAITGLVWGFQWFAKSLFWVTSAGKGEVEEVYPVSDTLVARNSSINITDNIWAQSLAQVKPKESISVAFASSPTGTIGISINHRPGTYYNTDANSYDQYTGKQLESKGVYSGKFSDASVAAKIKRMNYDIHVGAVLGIPGKILVFFASLIAASLPITGFYIWWGRRRKKPAKTAS